MTVVSWKPVEAYNPNAYLVALNAKSNPVSNIANTLSGLGDLSIQYADRAKNTLDFQTKLAEQEQKQLIERQNLMGQEFLADHPLFVQSLVDQASSGKAEDLAAARQRIAQLDAPAFIRDHLEKRIDKTYTDTLKNQETIAGTDQKTAMAEHYRWQVTEGKAKLPYDIAVLQGQAAHSNASANLANWQVTAGKEKLPYEIAETQARAKNYDASADQANADAEATRGKERRANIEFEAKQPGRDLQTNRDREELRQAELQNNVLPVLKNDSRWQGMVMAKVNPPIDSTTGKPTVFDKDKAWKLFQKEFPEYTAHIRTPDELEATLINSLSVPPEIKGFYEQAQKDMQARSANLRSQGANQFTSAITDFDVLSSGNAGTANVMAPYVAGAKDPKATEQKLSNLMQGRLNILKNQLEKERGGQPLNDVELFMLKQAMLETAVNPVDSGALMRLIAGGGKLDRNMFNDDAALNLFRTKQERLRPHNAFVRLVYDPNTGFAKQAQKALNEAYVSMQMNKHKVWSEAVEDSKNAAWAKIKPQLEGLSPEQQATAEAIWNQHFASGPVPNIPQYGVNQKAPAEPSIKQQRKEYVDKGLKDGSVKVSDLSQEELQKTRISKDSSIPERAKQAADIQYWQNIEQGNPVNKPAHLQAINNAIDTFITLDPKNPEYQKYEQTIVNGLINYTLSFGEGAYITGPDRVIFNVFNPRLQNLHEAKEKIRHGTSRKTRLKEQQDQIDNLFEQRRKVEALRQQFLKTIKGRLTDVDY